MFPLLHHGFHGLGQPRKLLRGVFEMESKKRVFVKKLKCGHVFHGSCIDKWLARAQNCPCCRESIIKKVPSSCGIEDLTLAERRRRQLVSYADLYYEFI